MLLLFNNFLGTEMRYMMGFVLIAFVFMFVVYNTIIMLLHSCKILIMIIRRQYLGKICRNKLVNEAKEVTKHI